MRLNKINTLAIVLLGLAQAACTSTTAPLATPIKQPTMPPVSSELLVKHERPERPASGSPQHLLDHAVRYGAYCQKLENQIGGWLAWYQGLSNETLPRID